MYFNGLYNTYDISVWRSLSPPYLVYIGSAALDIPAFGI
jgi:hypothetical protein